ncbi:MAG: hypothetical protein ACD_75C01367G0012 [uncultured bacterium]|nr:MAG: hypothetical protein ACD_75C01367G0012 [uncultured bacterium]
MGKSIGVKFFCHLENIGKFCLPFVNRVYPLSSIRVYKCLFGGPGYYPAIFTQVRCPKALDRE